MGDFAEGAAPGAIEGMNEGAIVVLGKAGHPTGDRRGMLVVKGGVGDYLGSRMNGGSILVLRPVGKSVRFGMRRGTILLGQRPGEAPRPQYQATTIGMEEGTYPLNACLNVEIG